MLGYTAFYPLPNAAFSAPGVIKDDLRAGADRSGPLQDEGRLAARQQDRRRALRRVPGRASRRSTASSSGSTSSHRGRTRTCSPDNLDVMTDDPDREPGAPRRATWATGTSTARCRRSSSWRSRRSTRTTRNVGRAQGHLDGDRPRRRSPSRSSRARRRRRARSSRRSSPGYRENTCGEAGEFNPAEAKTLYQAAGGPTKIDHLATTPTAAHKDWVDATCNQLKTNLGVDVRRLGRAEVRRPADQGREEDSRSACSGWAGSWTTRPWRTTSARSTARTARRTTTATATRSSTSWSQEGSAATTQDEAIAKYQQAEDILAKDMPVIPLRFGQNKLRPLDQGQERGDRPVPPGRPASRSKQPAELTTVLATRARAGWPGAHRGRRAADPVGGAGSPGRTARLGYSGTTRVPSCDPSHIPERLLSMFRYIVRRLLQMVLAFFGTTLIVYALMFAGQGDPIQALAGERPVTASPAGLPDREVPPRSDRCRRLLLPLLRLREGPAPGRPRRVAHRPADRRHPRRRPGRSPSGSP